MLLQRNRFLILFAACVALYWSGHTIGAVLVWTAVIALYHAFEETQGKLWAYFGKLFGVTWLNGLSEFLGFVFIVLPAVALQLYASYRAFSGESVAAFWLAMLIGARLSDALLSHIIPTVLSLRRNSPTAGVENPGLPTACIYVVDGLLLATI